MKKIFIGIDFSKEKFDVTVRNTVDGTTHYSVLPNTRGGGRDLVRMVKRSSVGTDSSEWLFCGEDTGIYSRVICRYLSEKGYVMWLESPYRIKHGSGLIIRGKDDRADSEMIADYARHHEDRAVSYVPAPKGVDSLRTLLASRNDAVKMRTMMTNSMKSLPADLDTETLAFLRTSKKRTIRELNKEIELIDRKISEISERDADISRNSRILRSFPGIGPINAACLIVHTNNFNRFDFDARKIATYWGVAPFSKQSGTSVRTGPHVSGFCNHWLKSMLSEAASCAILYNDTLRRYYQRLIARGKIDAVARNNVKNKMLHMLTAMVRKGEMYNPEAYIDLKAC